MMAGSQAVIIPPQPPHHSHPMCGTAGIFSHRTTTDTRATLLSLCKHLAALPLVVATPAWPTSLAVQTASEIRAEATRPNDGPQGRPLPLAASWNTGTEAGGYGPDYQLQMVGAGHHLLPWFQLDPPQGPRSVKSPLRYYRDALLQCAELGLPISFVSTQWESLLGGDPPPDANAITAAGKALPMLSPFGPAQTWADVGRQWTASTLVRQLQAWYPNPPKLVFLSNNEQPKLAWKDAAADRRYHGGNSDDAKRKAVGDGWISLYRALQAGLKEGLGEAWGKRSIFVGYDAFGSSAFGRWDGWADYSLYVKDRIEPWPLAWDGASPSYYVNDWDASTDYTVFSPPIAAMNWVFMLDEAYRLNPEFWFELSVWDGHQPGQATDKRAYYQRLGQTYTPQRYAGMVKFGMWLTRPRLLREYRNSQQTVAETGEYFLAIVQAVDELYRNPVLEKFWRHGLLVANTQHPHPYMSGIPAEYASKPRWHLLDSDADPKRPWSLDTPIPVFALALVTGTVPEREWLVYVHSPLSERHGIRLTLPDYGTLVIDAKPSGGYYWVHEKSRSSEALAGWAG